MGLSGVLNIPRVMSESLSRLDLFVYENKLARTSLNIVQTANLIAGLALSILFIPIIYQVGKRSPHSFIAVALNGFRNAYEPVYMKIISRMMIVFLPASIFTSLIDLSSRIFDYDRTSFMDVYKTMLNPKTETGFLIGNDKGPLHSYILKSAEIISKAQGTNAQDLLNQIDNNNRTRLHWAILKKDVDLFGHLIDMGVDLSLGPEYNLQAQNFGDLATTLSYRPLDEAFIENKPQFLKVAIEKHLKSNCQLLTEQVLRCFIDTIARKEEHQQLQLSDIQEILTPLFKQDLQAREYLKEKINALEKLSDDKSNVDEDTYVLPDIGPLRQLYNKSTL